MSTKLVQLLYGLVSALVGFGLRVGHLERSGYNESRILRLCQNSSQHTLISLPACENYNGLENAAQLHYKHEVDLLIGAACNEETETVSRLALRWRLLYLSSAPLSTKTREATTIALQPQSLSATAAAIWAVCQSNAWNQVGLVYSEERKYDANLLHDALDERLNVSAFVEVANIDALFSKTRVIVSFLPLASLQKLIYTWKSRASRPLEFALLHVDNHLSDAEKFYDDLHSDARGDEIAVSRLRRLHKNVLFLRNVHNDPKSMEKFAVEHGVQMSQELYRSLILCDGLRLLDGFRPEKRHDTNRSGEEARVERLEQLWKHVTNREVQGLSGPVLISSSSVRLPYFQLLMWSQQQVQVVADVLPNSAHDTCNDKRYPSACYRLVGTSKRALLDNLPPAVPECGYEGEFCGQKHFVVIVVVVLLIILIPLCIAFYLQRKEYKIQKMPWRVAYQSLVFATDDPNVNGSTDNDVPAGFRRISSTSVNLWASGESLPSSEVGLEAEHCFINKQKVSVKRFLQKRAITFSRSEMELLSQLKYISNTNINEFLGICFNQGTELLVLWTYTTRHSLDDIIFKKKQRFGRNFQSTFIKHIVHGLTFIHNSPIKVHGALFLTNCVVDSYWVVKLTDFGVRHILSEKIRHKDLLNFPPIDFDRLDSKYLECAPELLNEMYERRELPLGSVESDVFQLGMIIYQIIFYLRPFAHRTDAVGDVLELIRTGSKFAPQPRVPEDAKFTTRLLSVMQQCWLQRPAARPLLFKVSDAVVREFEADIKGTLVDQMILMIDEYSANLETIVAQRTRDIEQSLGRTEKLLYQFIPKSIADELREGRQVHPEQCPSVSLLVVDLCQFTSFCESLIPVHVLESLQDLYSAFDVIVQKYKAFKVENVGDAYLVASGIPPMNDLAHLREVARVALRIREFVSRFVVRHKKGYKMHVKLGISSGVVAVGVLGSTAPRFTMFGDTVNMASRMANCSLPDHIQLSELTGSVLQEKFPQFVVEERGLVDVKNKGMCLTYWLNGEDKRRASSRKSSTHSRSDSPQATPTPSFGSNFLTVAS